MQRTTLKISDFLSRKIRRYSWSLQTILSFGGWQRLFNIGSINFAVLHSAQRHWAKRPPFFPWCLSGFYPFLWFSVAQTSAVVSQSFLNFPSSSGIAIFGSGNPSLGHKCSIHVSWTNKQMDEWMRLVKQHISQSHGSVSSSACHKTLPYVSRLSFIQPSSTGLILSFWSYKQFIPRTTHLVSKRSYC